MRRELIEARQRAGLTRAELADKLGIDETMVQKVETGKRNPSVKLAKRWATFFGITAWWELFYADQPDNMSETA